jgi:hypothetical protein
MASRRTRPDGVNLALNLEADSHVGQEGGDPVLVTACRIGAGRPVRNDERVSIDRPEPADGAPQDARQDPVIRESRLQGPIGEVMILHPWVRRG